MDKALCVKHPLADEFDALENFWTVEYVKQYGDLIHDRQK